VISYAKTNLTINGYPIEMTLRLTFVGEVGYKLLFTRWTTNPGNCWLVSRFKIKMINPIS